MLSTSHANSSNLTSDLSGFEIVANLLNRQDAVLAELDQLNERVEVMIKELTAVRQAEIAAQMIDHATDQNNLLVVENLPLSRAA